MRGGGKGLVMIGGWVMMWVVVGRCEGYGEFAAGIAGREGFLFFEEDGGGWVIG